MAGQAIEALNVGGVESTASLTDLDQRPGLRPVLFRALPARHQHAAPLDDTARDFLKVVPFARLDHLPEDDTGPLHQRRAPSLAPMERTAEGFAELLHVGCKTVKDHQERPAERTGAYLERQRPDQELVAAPGDGPAEPQARGHTEGQRHRQDAALGLDPDLVGLYLLQVHRVVFKYLLVQGLTMPAGRLLPVGYGTFPASSAGQAIESIGLLDGGRWGAVGQERDHLADELVVVLAAIEEGAACGGEGLVALAAAQAIFFLGVQGDVVLSRLSVDRALGIGTACLHRVHAASSG